MTPKVPDYTVFRRQGAQDLAEEWLALAAKVQGHRTMRRSTQFTIPPTFALAFS